MTSMPRGIRVGMMLAIAGALLIPPGAADAKKKKKPKSPPVTVVSSTGSTSADNQQLTVTATCPAGKIAVGGGFSVPLLSTTTFTDVNLPYESRRASQSSWQASVVREDTAGPGPSLSLTTRVDCRSTQLTAKQKSSKSAEAAKKKKKKLRVTEVSASQATPPASGAIADATASCPAGMTALGGGFTSFPAPNLASPAYPVFWASYRASPSTWRSAFTNSNSTARTVTSYAYCTTGLKIAETSATVPLPASGGGTISTATASAPPCTKGRALLGGGFNNSPTVSGGPILFPTGEEAAGKSWQASAFNFFTVPGTVSSIGYCA